MSTIRDVANLAGVGLGTVSRAINGTGYVAPDTKNKVMKAAEELNYTPNELARQLLKKKNHIVGIMIPDLAHPFFSKILSSILWLRRKEKTIKVKSQCKKNNVRE